MNYIDLHRHLEGCIRPATIYELRNNSKATMNLKLEDIEDLMIVKTKEEQLSDYLDKLGTRFMRLVTKSPEHSYRFMFEAIEDAAREQIEYVEIRVCLPNFQGSDHINEMHRATIDAQKKFGIKTGIISVLVRDYAIKQNELVAEETIRYFEQGIVCGVDLAGNENGKSLLELKTIFAKFAKHRIPITIHAGEEGSFQNIELAITQLGACRIGHGTAAIKSKEVMNLIRDSGVLIECCISSNYHTSAIASLNEHPLKQLMEYGINCAICTDDPVTSNTSMIKETEIAQSVLGITTNQTTELFNNSLRYKFTK